METLGRNSKALKGTRHPRAFDASTMSEFQMFTMRVSGETAKSYYVCLYYLSIITKIIKQLQSPRIRHRLGVIY
jgi:hypothetical protein